MVLFLRSDTLNRIGSTSKSLYCVQCEHAFPDRDYVGYDDSEWILHRQEGDIDYSDIEDGWYEEYVDLDELDEECAEAYQMGHQEGFEDGSNNRFYEYELTEYEFDHMEVYDDYVNGYSDGYTEGQAVYEEEDNIFNDDGILFAGTIDQFLQGMIGELKLNSMGRGQELEKLNKTPQSQVDWWSIDSIVDDIISGRLTTIEFVQLYNPTEEALFKVLNEIDLNR